MGLNINSETNADFKYEMNDLTVLYYGAKYTYQEILDDVVSSFKLKHIIRIYFLNEVDPETTIESHLYYMEPESESALVYKQLKVKVRVSVPVIKKKLFGGEEKRYTEKIIPIEKFMEWTPEEKKQQGIVIHEVQISKLGLMSFAL